MRAPQGSRFFHFAIHFFSKHSRLGGWQPPTLHEVGVPYRKYWICHCYRLKLKYSQNHCRVFVFLKLFASRPIWWYTFWNDEPLSDAMIMLLIVYVFPALNLRVRLKKNRTMGPWLIWQVKSGEFHEIRRISWQGLIQCISVLVLMKNTAFSGIPWNLADFMVKSSGFHGKDLYTAYLACNRLIMYICIGSDTVYLYWF